MVIHLVCILCSQISVLQKENQTIQASCDEMESNLQTAKANMTAEKEKVKKSEGDKMELQAKVICLTSEKDRISELLRLKSEECDGAKKDAQLKGEQVDSLTKEKANLEVSHAQQVWPLTMKHFLLIFCNLIVVGWPLNMMSSAIFKV